MGQGSWKKGYVQCPFYVGDGKKSILCEGIFDRSRVASTFRRRADFHRQLEIYCCGCWEKCEIAVAIKEAKYPD